MKWKKRGFSQSDLEKPERFVGAVFRLPNDPKRYGPGAGWYVELLFFDAERGAFRYKKEMRRPPHEFGWVALEDLPHCRVCKWGWERK
ncbi:MAG: hypothetical protein DRP15_04375 [Candidatus Aenigmatarchaeota archaeon]|mgnify:CR=1 FL=1|nr:MAG: hypothetical protein DRP15_04375 [Candidatus Aenigmarchaeota archaeon]